MRVFGHLESFAFVAILIMAFSCSKEDEKLELEPQTCEVTISGMTFDQEKGGGGLKVMDIKRRKNTPISVDGYKVKVENLSFPDIPEINEEFHFVDNNWDKPNGRITTVTEGENQFTAESYGGSPINDWVDVDKIDGVSDKQDRVGQYGDDLEIDYPCYTLYRDTKRVDIKPKNIQNKNDVVFNMKPVNGRLAIIVENNKKRIFGWFDYIKVRIGEFESDNLGYGDVVAYIFNDNTSSKEIEVEVKMYYGLSFLKSSITKLSLESGKNKTRLIVVENE